MRLHSSLLLLLLITHTFCKEVAKDPLSLASTSHSSPQLSSDEEHAAHLERYLNNEEKVANQKAGDDYIVGEGPCTRIDLATDNVGPSWIEVRWLFRCEQVPAQSRIDFELTFGADLHAVDSYRIVPNGRIRLDNLYEHVEYRVCVIAHFTNNPRSSNQTANEDASKGKAAHLETSYHYRESSNSNLDEQQDTKAGRNYERRCEYVTTADATPISSFVIIAVLLLVLVVLLTISAFQWHAYMRRNSRERQHRHGDPEQNGAPSYLCACACSRVEDRGPAYTPLQTTA